jgi:hypothetical protein
VGPLSDPKQLCERPHLEHEGEAGSVCTSVCTPLLGDAEVLAAIASVTRALAATDDATLAGELVAERRALRAELQEVRASSSGGVVDLGRERTRRR